MLEGSLPQRPCPKGAMLPELSHGPPGGVLPSCTKRGAPSVAEDQGPWAPRGITEMQQSAPRGPGPGGGGRFFLCPLGASASHKAGASSPWRWVTEGFTQQMFIEGLRTEHLARAEHLDSHLRGSDHRHKGQGYRTSNRSSGEGIGLGPWGPGFGGRSASSRTLATGPRSVEF